ncbi:protein ANTAGONIST OF LIKE HETEROCHROMATIN PROTEIN 1-like [Camponotus floridanus]|uniref:protein ANTAGONIST OF LIKE HETEROCHROMATIN PROTEIN 1-like n=1 Tax=Camponotus floridanus TaxID=104421 RepID=UPI00059C9C24|nr:protein ANTAGONIST OF LIKE HETEROCHROMATIN PROTEIN 1-like [Camponotus floridanus]
MAADLSSSSDSLTLTSSSSDVFNDNEIITNSSDEFEISSSNEETEYDILFSLYQLLMHGKRRSKVQGFLDTVHLYSDATFKEHFRLQRHTAYLQIDILRQSSFIPSHSSGMRKISAEWSFLIFLWYIANTEPLRTMGDRFNVSISSIFRVIRRIVEWLLSRLDEEIKWPEGNNTILMTSQNFEAKRGIKKCIGAIDCTHIAIRQPVDHPRDYCNRKRFFSIILQGVVDADMKFTNIYCGEPGSLHDARVLRRSLLYDTAQNDMENIFPNGMCIIGDSAYPSLPWLVPPFRDNGHLTAQQSEFNFLHSSTRIVVERAFGYLKGRFRRLKFLELLDIEFIPKLITAICIMHNIVIKANEENEFFENAIIDFLEDNDAIDNNEIYNLQHVNGHRNEIDRRMQMFRELFPD